MNRNAKYFLNFFFIAAISLLAFGNTAEAATFSLSPLSGTTLVGEILNVDILMDTTGDPIDGFEVYSLHYDPKVLEVLDADPSTPQVEISDGTLLPVTTINIADKNHGTIKFGQVVGGGEHFTGSGKVASISFRGAAAGISALSFDAARGDTTDTNISSGGEDKLSSAQGAIISILPGIGGIVRDLNGDGVVNAVDFSISLN